MRLLKLEICLLGKKWKRIRCCSRNCLEKRRDAETGKRDPPHQPYFSVYPVWGCWSGCSSWERGKWERVLLSKRAATVYTHKVLICLLLASLNGNSMLLTCIWQKTDKGQPRRIEERYMCAMPLLSLWMPPLVASLNLSQSVERLQSSQFFLWLSFPGLPL